MIRITSLLLLFIVSVPAFSQSDSVAYSKDFEFKEGVYLNYEQFRENRPIAKDKIVSNYNPNGMSFIGDVLSKEHFTYKDGAGAEQKVRTNSIWGYCSNRTIYINYKNDFNRVPIIGSVCHFTAYVYSYASYNNPYMDNSMLNTIPDLRQFMIDTKTGSIYEFLPANLELILVRDAELFKEFSALTRKKKRDSTFLYIRKYNEKHPLVFPGRQAK